MLRQKEEGGDGDPVPKVTDKLPADFDFKNLTAENPIDRGSIKVGPFYLHGRRGLALAVPELSLEQAYYLARFIVYGEEPEQPRLKNLALSLQADTQYWKGDDGKPGFKDAVIEAWKNQKIICGEKGDPSYEDLSAKTQYQNLLELTTCYKDHFIMIRSTHLGMSRNKKKQDNDAVDKILEEFGGKNNRNFISLRPKLNPDLAF